ncbi:flavin-containing monooxygenase [Mangrovihabitans endophyticus]|uniref:Flavin-binding monooxygenase n=1 Tax=Mangrovihabitans endophyticus TaxID=1751298 RepID=A0A8J3C6Q3_9ACTN|nr:NAD(P)-binding domain-containing protein [Mangrovihabitans endophyticus]GGL16925.1 flavin-binding monooxygenase [Mangrovihabitans endophyticus]
MADTPLADRTDAVCVIGAGGSGLAAVKSLREHGFAVDCYERETSVGGAWNWRHDRSPVSSGTHLISSRPLTEFPDFPMPDSWPDYPRHSQVLSYLERYAAHFGLREHIWFGTEVVAATPVGDGRWDVTTRSTGGGAERTQRYAAVVAANGHNWSPKPVTLEGADDFRGRILPASAYKDPAQLRGRKVLVIGGGNTGCDIAVEAAQHAAAVWHSTRRGYWYAPKFVLGRPADQINALARRWRLPLRLRQWLYHRTVRLTVGDVTRFGLAAPDHRPYESHPLVNSQLIYYVGHGRITPVADVARLEAFAVTLTDGMRVEPDLIVTATGYLPRFEFLAPQLLDMDDDGRPDLHLHAFARRHPTLAVIGLVQSDGGLFPLAHWQSVAVARWLRLRIADPARAGAVQQKESQRPIASWSRTRTVPSSRHWFEVSFVDYLRALGELIDRLEPA